MLKYFNYTIMGLFLLVIVIIAFRCVMNYNGYCFEQKRYLSEQEKINLVAQNIVHTYPQVIQFTEMHENNDGVLIPIHRKERPKNAIPYKNVEELFEINPSCCEIRDNANGYKPSFSHRINGNISGFVWIKYLVRYKDKSDVVVSQNTQTYRAVSNCGRVWGGT